MKKTFLFLTVVLIAVKSFCQTPENPSLTKDYYLKKSKNQKTAGWVLLGGGVVMASVGLAISSRQITDDPIGYLTTDKGNASVAVAITGLGISLFSIPFFISSAKNARRAATISFNNQKVYYLQQNGLALKTVPSLTLRISL